MGRRLFPLLACWLFLLFLAALFSPSLGRASDNLLQNPSFEEGAEPWKADHSATEFITVTTPVHEGGWAASLSSAAQGADFTIYIYQDVEEVKGGCYSLSGWAYLDSAQVDWVSLRIEWLDSSGVPLGKDESDKLMEHEADYRPLCVPKECGSEGVLAPNGAVRARIKALARVRESNPSPVFFDDFIFIQVAPPLPTPTPSPVLPLLISEVLYDGTTPRTEGDEFVEIYNPWDESIELSPYRLGDEETMGGSEGMYFFPRGMVIEPGGLLVVAKNGAQFKERFGFYPDAEVRVSGSGFSDTPGVPNMIPNDSWASGEWALDNRGDEVLLLDRDYQLVDGVAYKKGDYEAVGVRGKVSAGAPLSFHRVGDEDNDDMQADFLIADPNPGVLTDYPPLPPSPPEAIPLSLGMKAFFGDLHAHTTYSDGTGPPRYAYAVARANGLHFLGLSDHGYMLDQRRWEELKVVAEEATMEGAFLALPGLEWTHQTVGHINVFESPDLISREQEEGDTLKELYEWLTTQEGAVAQFNHPGYYEGDFKGFRYDAQADEAIGLLEVGNGTGTGYRRYEEAYLQALYKGWRVGAANNSDTHSLAWGAETPHRTGVVAPTLTKEEIMAALREGRTFATEDANLALALRAGESWMGSTLPVSPTLSLTVEAADLDGEGVTLELFDGGLAVASQKFPPGLSHIWTVEIRGREGHFYWAKATQPDGDVAYSSPLWMEGQAVPDVVLLNEILPAPQEEDWDRDGSNGPEDEWVELFNPTKREIGLGGWRLDDIAKGGSPPYTIPSGVVIPPHGFLVLFRKETGVALNDDGDQVRLLRPDGSVADQFRYEEHPGYDRSFSLTVDGDGSWTTDYQVTMGQANRPWPAPEPPTAPEPTLTTYEPLTISEARVIKWGTEVAVWAQVSVTPGLFSVENIYIQDGSGGISIYLRKGAYPSLKEGDWVRIIGEVRDYHGEREIRIEEGGIEFLRCGEAVVAKEMATTEVGEEREGLLAEVIGVVTEVEGWAFYLDDGVGEAKVYIREATGIEDKIRPGEALVVVGVVSQYASSAPYEGGYRLLPRYEGDIRPAPVYLPPCGEERTGP